MHKQIACEGKFLLSLSPSSPSSPFSPTSSVSISHCLSQLVSFLCVYPSSTARIPKILIFYVCLVRHLSVNIQKVETFW